MNEKFDTVADRAGHWCEYCHAPEAAFNFPFERLRINSPKQIAARRLWALLKIFP